MKCAVCGKEFIPTRSTQRYCSSTCRRYAIHHGINDNRVEESTYVLAIREFTCLRCGKRVRVTDPRDCRTKFCSQHCEKLYWKHPDVKSVTVHREFTCRECGKVVVVETPKDRRRAFCCDACRKKWFNRNKNILNKERSSIHG